MTGVTKIIIVTDRRMKEWWSGMERGNRGTWKEASFSATLSTTYYIWTGLRSDPNIHDKRSATDRLSQGIATKYEYVITFKSGK
jgi:hypothetical protein